MIDYYVRRIPFPNNGAKAATYINDDGSFDIYLSTNYPEPVQEEALKHELKHIYGDHFYTDMSTAHAEAEAGARVTTVQVPAPSAPLPLGAMATTVDDTGRSIPLYSSLKEYEELLWKSGEMEAIIRQAEAQGVKLYGLSDKITKEA